MYHPNPIDTAKIKLPESLFPLIEQLAAHNHDIWARQRIAEGWSWGSNRDDAMKKHPDLVPYEELPESEKEYDRSTVRQTLMAIAALGYRFEKY